MVFNEKKYNGTNIIQIRNFLLTSKKISSKEFIHLVIIVLCLSQKRIIPNPFDRQAKKKNKKKTQLI